MDGKSCEPLLEIIDDPLTLTASEEPTLFHKFVRLVLPTV